MSATRKSQSDVIRESSYLVAHFLNGLSTRGAMSVELGETRQALTGLCECTKGYEGDGWVTILVNSCVIGALAVLSTVGVRLSAEEFGKHVLQQFDSLTDGHETVLTGVMAALRYITEVPE